MLSPNGIQAILFDLDGTLRHNRPLSVQVFLDYAVQNGAQDSPEQRRSAIRWTHYYWAQSVELMEDIEAFKDQHDPFWLNYARRHLQAFACEPDLIERLAPQIHRYMEEQHRPQDWLPPDVPATLQLLKEAGFRLGVLSNRQNPCRDYLEELGIAHFFDLALVAGEVAAWKPQPEIFFHALERLGAIPEETLYVGDNFYADVVGARRAGLQPVLIDPDEVFPDAGCTVIRQIGELPKVLQSQLSG